MNAAALLVELERRGIRVWAEAGKLRYDAPRDALDAPLREQVKACRDELLALLGERAGHADGPRPIPRDGELPLSFGQQRLWFLDQLAPEDRAYNVPATVHLRGRLDQPALQRALDEIVRRHESLRCRLPDVDGRPGVVIEPAAPVPVTVEDVPGDSPDERLAEATRRARADAVQPFDLARGPLFRVRLFRLGSDEQVLHVLMHHVISDGWSMGVFFRELSALYQAFAAGRPSPLAELPLQVVDHAAWQRSPAGQRSLAAGLDWWTATLGDDLPELALPSDRPRQGDASSAGASLWFPVDADLRDALLQLARREGVTRFQLLLSAFAVLLARHTGQEDIVLGTPVAGRGRREVEGLIGFFVNNLVLRLDLSGDPTFRDLLQRVRGRVLDAFAHQDTPFEKLVEALAPERRLGRNPLFQVLFNHFDLSDFEYALPPLQLDTIDMTLDVSKFDLTLHCFEKDEILVAKLEFDTSLFDERSVRRLGERYLTLLRGLVEDPARPIARLPLLPPNERRELLVAWGRGASAPVEATCVHGLFERQAASHPTRTALVCGAQRLTYAELDARADAWARRLLADGVAPEDTVALVMQRGVDMIVGLLAVLKAGGAYVPIEPSTPTERLAAQLERAACRVLLVDERGAAALPAADGLVRRVDRPAEMAVDAGDAAALPATRPGQLAYVLSTSGSTGEPKAVEVEHAQLLDYLAGIRPELDVPDDSHFATVSSLAVDLGLTCVFPALCHGGTLHVLDEQAVRDGDAAAAAMAAGPVDVLKIVPGHLAGLLDAAADPAAVLPRRLLVLGGEACAWELVERVAALAPGCRVLNHYGPAETTVGVLTQRVTPADRARWPTAPPLGRPLANARVYVVDGRGELVPPGSEGELWVSGPAVARGYRGRPELTAERFRDDPFRRDARARLYATGDRVRHDADGRLHFLGRVDDQVKIRGHRVEPGEVAAVLAALPGVAQAHVAVDRDDRGRARLVAYAVPASGSQPDAEALRAALARRLPEPMLPAGLLLLDELPRTAHGKLDRAALPSLDRHVRPATAGFVAPRSEAERTLAAIWCDVLRLDRVGVHDDFFELGGESILSIQIVSRANRAGLGLAAKDVFEWSTIAELAQVARTPGVVAQDGPCSGPLPLTPIQRRFFAQEQAEPGHYHHAHMLRARRSIDPDDLRVALGRLQEHHDVLRARFTRAADGSWSQQVEAPGGPVPLAVHDLAGLDGPARARALSEGAEALTAGIDLEHGPPWRAAWWALGDDEPSRLLLVAHHLVVDGVSWRLLLEDLSTALEALAEAREAAQPAAPPLGPVDQPRLPPRTASYHAWSQACLARAAEPACAARAARWLDLADDWPGPLPVDHAPPPPGSPAAARHRCRAHDHTLTVELDAVETEQLLRGVPRAYRTRIDDVLLTALARACAPWTGSRRLALDLEGHGRQDALGGLDVSRTVGWFTSVHPVVLEVGEGDDPGADLCAVKEQLRALPDQGVDWGLLRWLSPDDELRARLAALPAAQIGFNFMGHFERSLAEGALFEPAPEAPGRPVAESHRRPYLLDVGGAVRDGRLVVHWTWSEDVHRRRTIETLAERFLAALRQLIAHATTPGVGRSTPSDYPAARLDERELAGLLERHGAAQVEDVHRLSPLQRGMVFHALAEPGGDAGAPAYVTQLGLTLRGDLDERAFRRAWERVQAASPVLRSAIAVHGLRELHQVVCRDVPLDWSAEDARGLDEDQRARHVERLARDDHRRGFALERPPLMRLRLVRLADDAWRLIWTHHHVLLDGWSLPLLVQDVFAAYGAERSGRSDGDAVAHRRPFSAMIRWLDAQPASDDDGYWTALLEGWPGPTPLPAACSTVGPAGRGVSGDRATRGRLLSAESSAALAAMARREHLTLSTLVQGAWALLLSRYGASDDVLFGVTVSGRPPDLPGVEGILGMFINTLPLRVDTSDAPLTTWLARLQQQSLELQQRQATPLHEVQQGAGLPPGTALFDSLVVFENYPAEVREPLRTAGLRFEEATDVSHATTPLALVVQPGEQLSLQLRHDTRRFTAAAVDQLLRHLAQLLEDMARRPGCRLAELSMLPTDEAALVARALRPAAQPSPYPRAAGLPELFAEQVRAHPSAPAVEHADERIDYAELDRRSRRVARSLRAAGVAPGDLVALPVPRGVGLVVAMLAVVRAGAAYLPLDPDDPARRVERLLGESGARALLSTREVLGGLDLDWAGPRLALDDLDGASGSGGDADPDDPLPLPTPCADDLAYVMYTSGSTGRPKGVMVPQRAVARLVLGTDYVQLAPGQRVAQLANPAFDAVTFEIWGALLNGACVVPVAREVALSPAALGSFLRERRVDVLFVTTALFHQLARHEPGLFGCLDTLLFGGEAIDPRAVARVLESGPPRRLLHVYGPTECTTFSTWHPVTAVAADAASVPIGRPIAHGHARVLDGHGRPVPPGALGELFLGGDGLARGYLGRPERTAERFVADELSDEPGALLYRTGDVVRLTLDGELEFVGRLDGQVKLRGFRIETGEVEAALRSLPGVRAATVLLHEDGPGDARLVGYVEADDGAEQVDGWRAALASELPAHMLPEVLVPLPSLPLTANGKLDRRALPAPPRPGVAPAGVPLRNDLERRVAALWCEVLGRDEVGRQQPFFELGGHSLKLLALHVRLVDELGARLSITDLFEHTTVAAQARALAESAGPPAAAGAATVTSPGRHADAGHDDPRVAIVAMAGRFPGAADVEGFWSNLCAGVESIRRFGRDELLAAGVPAALVDDPRYVPARAVLDDPDCFDAALFGYTPLEARLMDPQQRLFLECCHEALERAAIDGQRWPGRIGVYAGASMNSYLERLRAHPELLRRAGGLAALISSIHDFLTTRVSYQLDLRGPSVNVQTACSTSLVAVHEACRGLVEGRCDVALAGGVSVTVPWIAGYLHEVGGVRSSDGHCRAFDAAAEGMVSGNAVGVVVLRRLADALADGDEIQAVIRGTAINNDGARKLGFTAPSIEGQAEVIAAAQRVAGVDPASIGYVECHGTGTALGDPVEVAALTRVFRERTDARGFCALASLKSNMGHLDAAAGVAGLIKAALAVRHGAIPPSLHFERPNPELDLASSPFFVNTTCRDWRPAGDAPRRAAVSAFGIGGTNAHAVLEQPPAPAPWDGPPARPLQLLQLSAHSATALDGLTGALAEHLGARPELDLGDVAHSLARGRRRRVHRRALLVGDGADAARVLSGATPGRSWTRRALPGRSVVFLFPGQGAQVVGMGRQLCAVEPAFAALLHDACDRLHQRTGLELLPVLHPDDPADPRAAERLAHTAWAQPALFVVEYALARLWMSWGVRPAATLGHSVGELVSACLAGVLGLDDALTLVAERGRCMAAQPPGSMAAVDLDEQDLGARLAGRAGLWMAAINGPGRCVVAGDDEALAAFSDELLAQGRRVTPLRTSHAFHSGLMDGALAPFEAAVRAVPRRAPDGVPYVSSLTGDWVGADQVADPRSWSRQIREPVRWADGLARVAADPDAVLLEVGPGRTLAQLAAIHPALGPGRIVLSSLPTSVAAAADRRDAAGDPGQPLADPHELRDLLACAGQLWTAGLDVDVLGPAPRRRVTLPTHPLERQRHWVDDPGSATATNGSAASGRRALEEWLHVPVWRRAPAAAASDGPRRALVLAGAQGTARRLARALADAGVDVSIVTSGSDFARGADGYRLDASVPDQVGALLDDLRGRGGLPDLVVHGWCADAEVAEVAGSRADAADGELERGFLALAGLARALCQQPDLPALDLVVLTRGVYDVRGEALAIPERAAVLGVVRVLGLEQPGIRCRLIDLGLDDDPADESALLAELASETGDPVVALRSGRRWIESFVPVPAPAVADRQPPLEPGAVWLITGGLGGLGLALARQLHERAAARLVLVSRRALPSADMWAQTLARLAPDDPLTRPLSVLVELVERGAELLVLSADVSLAADCQRVARDVRERFGRLDGVVHAAGLPPAGLLITGDAARSRAVLAPKVAGTRALLDAVAPLSPRRVVLCSSLNAVMGFPGAADYAAANAVLDAHARRCAEQPGPRIVSLAWNRWRESGMAVAAHGGPLADDQGIGDAEGGEVLWRVLAHDPGPHVLVSEFPLLDLLRRRQLDGVDAGASAGGPSEGPEVSGGAAAGAGPGAGGHPRPELSSSFVAPAGAEQQRVAALWEELFGVTGLGVHDDFFELGGHSLLATRLLARLGERCPGAAWSLAVLFERTTIAGQAAFLAEEADRPTAASDEAPAIRPRARPELTDLDGLSDDEVSELLRRLGGDGPRDD